MLLQASRTAEARQSSADNQHVRSSHGLSSLHSFATISIALPNGS